MLVQESPVLLFECQIQPPEIAFVLRLWIGLQRIVNHPELDESGIRTFHPRLVEKAERKRLEHSLLAAMIEIALLNA